MTQIEDKRNSAVLKPLGICGKKGPGLVGKMLILVEKFSDPPAQRQRRLRREVDWLRAIQVIAGKGLKQVDCVQVNTGPLINQPQILEKPVFDRSE